MLRQRSCHITAITVFYVFIGIACTIGGPKAAINDSLTLVQLLSKEEKTEEIPVDVIVRNCVSVENKQHSCSAGSSSSFSVDIGSGQSLTGGVNFVANGQITLGISEQVGFDLGFNRGSGQSLSFEIPPKGYLTVYSIEEKYVVKSGQAVIESSTGTKENGKYTFRASCELTIIKQEILPCNDIDIQDIDTPTYTATPTPTNTPTGTLAPTPTPTDTDVPPTFTNTPTGTSTPTSTPTYTPIPASSRNLTNGLVAYYSFEGNANDQSGNGNNGTVHGATLASDRKGNPNGAYRFDGVDDYISVPDNNMLDLPNVRTICVWFQPSEIKAAHIVSKLKSDTVEDGYSIIAHQNNSIRMLVKDDFDNRADVPVDSYNAGEWIFACLVISNKTVSGFVNGSYVGPTGTIQGQTSGNLNSVLIGGSYRGTGEISSDTHFNGVIDEVRIYNRVLTDEELRILSEF